MRSSGSVTGRPLTTRVWCAALARLMPGAQAKPLSTTPSRSPCTASRAAAASGPSRAAMRAARSCAGRSNRVRPSLSRRMATCGAASARRRMAASVASASARGDLRNLRRAGVAKNSSRTTTRVPGPPGAGAASPTAPPSTRSSTACAAPAGREVIARRAAAPMLGSASPRKPRVAMRSRASSLASSGASLEVAWRCTAMASSAASMPQPSSATSMRAMPPCSMATAMRVAPESSAFSTSSRAAAAGRSITSPAAIRLIVASLSSRMRPMTMPVPGLAGRGSGAAAGSSGAA